MQYVLRFTQWCFPEAIPMTLICVLSKWSVYLPVGMVSLCLVKQFHIPLHWLSSQQTFGVSSHAIWFSISVFGYTCLIVAVNLSFCRFVQFFSVISALTKHCLTAPWHYKTFPVCRSLTCHLFIIIWDASRR